MASPLCLVILTAFFTAQSLSTNLNLSSLKTSLSPPALSSNKFRNTQNRTFRSRPIITVSEYTTTVHYLWLITPYSHHPNYIIPLGQAILHTQFPNWHVSPETYLLACLLHDIGTTPENLKSTLLSFEFHGGILALDLLYTRLHAPQPQAEAVVEAIIRHQDIGTTGTITTLGQILQLATIFDNMGGHEELVHQKTIESVVQAYPRKGWSGCFSATIRNENRLKPWAHTSALGEDEFPDGVLGNKLMEPYD